MRRMGPYVMMDVIIVVHHRMSVSAAHQVAERVRLSIMQQHPGVSEVLVHVDSEDDNHDDVQMKLMRPQHAIETDVRKVLKDFPDIKELSHFTCHYFKNQLCVQLEVVMWPSLTIREARDVAHDVQAALKQKISDVQEADVHLELCADSHAHHPTTAAAAAADQDHGKHADDHKHEEHEHDHDHDHDHDHHDHDHGHDRHNHDHDHPHDQPHAPKKA